ncbi:hypothetical protein J7438_07135 [Thalassotalea sp. G20_0]|uniref:hypothetical protein n=1 Tax=Thalassotalea sp. G20_0 TaxID=2821093 RepID=UPI001ADB88AC|nr:hypothetical protein [Thalassotalea sp. G20_0]MBO9493859.1 hypothetical protein [Thalassotalea sp. G20_0]
MQKVPYHNKTEKPVHIGAVTVPPNQTRMVESQYLLIKAREDLLETTAAVWNLEAFVKQNQETEIAQLPELTDQQLEQVVAHYSQNTPPKKLKPALEAEVVTREEARKADEYVTSLETMSDEELKAELLSVGDDEGKLALVQDQLSKRKEV